MMAAARLALALGMLASSVIMLVGAVTDIRPAFLVGALGLAVFSATSLVARPRSTTRPTARKRTR